MHASQMFLCSYQISCLCTCIHFHIAHARIHMQSKLQKQNRITRSDLASVIFFLQILVLGGCMLSTNQNARLRLVAVPLGLLNREKGVFLRCIDFFLR